MSLGFAAVVAFLPHIFKLSIAEMMPRHWIMLAAITAGGVMVLILGTLAVRPLLKKLEA